MRNFTLIIAIIMLSGCSLSPPEPPKVKGEYRPVNNMTVKNNNSSIEQQFDFNFEGDITDSLYALKRVQPQLQVMKPLGKRITLPVRINLQHTTLDESLKAIADQGGGVADVVRNKYQNNNQVFIRFHQPFTQK